MAVTSRTACRRRAGDASRHPGVPHATHITVLIPWPRRDAVNFVERHGQARETRVVVVARTCESRAEYPFLASTPAPQNSAKPAWNTTNAAVHSVC